MQNNYKKVIVLVGIFVAVISLWAVKVEASDIVVKDVEVINIGIEEIGEYIIDVFNIERENSVKEVRIYNNQDNLVRVAKEGSIILQPVINKADYLLEVDGIKYYRIN